jgi:hypothetical protein
MVVMCWIRLDRRPDAAQRVASDRRSELQPDADVSESTDIIQREQCMAHSVSRPDDVFALISEMKGSGYASCAMGSSKLKADDSFRADLIREIFLEEGRIGSGYWGAHGVGGSLVM